MEFGTDDLTNAGQPLAAGDGLAPSLDFSGYDLETLVDKKSAEAENQ
jgi:hypothetical protein